MNTQLEDIKRLCSYLQGLQAEHEKKEAELKRLAERIEYFKTDIIPSHIMSLGLSKLSLDDGQEISITTKYFASISEERSQRAHQWLKDHKLGSLIKTSIGAVFASSLEDQVDLKLLGAFLKEKEIDTTTKEAVHAQTLKAAMRELIESGTRVPADLFALTIVKEVSIGK